MRRGETLWVALNRLWGRAESMVDRISYRGTPKGDLRYSGCFNSVQWTIEIVRDPLPDPVDVPAVAGPLVLRDEICILAHELAHARSKVTQPRTWDYYFAALCRWDTIRGNGGPPLTPEWGRLILEEEERAEDGGQSIIREICPEVHDHFMWRAEQNLRKYRELLGL